MPNLVKKVLRKAKKTHRPHKAIALNPFAQALAKQRGILAWEQDKIIKRDSNFKKLLQGQHRYRAEQDAEKERQEEISMVRLKNLKKARRAKEKKYVTN